jgi:hypothetical protein
MNLREWLDGLNRARSYGLSGLGQGVDVVQTAIEGWTNTAQLALLFDRRGWMTDPVSTAARAVPRLIPEVMTAPVQMQSAILTNFVLAGRWAVGGFPVVAMTHRLTATLMATSVSAEALEYVRAPWPAVAVRLPNDLLYLENERGELVSATTLVFGAYEHNGRTAWAYVVATDATHVDPQGLSVWAIHLPTNMLTSEDLPHDLDMLSRGAVDNRTDFMARRLMVGLCLWVSDPKNLGKPRQSRPQRPRGERQRPPGVLPTFQVWQLGKDIQLDPQIIHAVRDYIREGGRSPRVQSLVTGHWKMQQHGPQRGLRKLIHVMPYWRGPLDAPVLQKKGDR